MSRIERIKNLITKHCSNIFTLDIEDESHMHRGSQNPHSHLKLFLVSDFFKDMPKVARQREVMGLCRDEFNQGLHALSMRLLTVDEYNASKTTFETPPCSGRGE